MQHKTVLSCLCLYLSCFDASSATSLVKVIVAGNVEKTVEVAISNKATLGANNADCTMIALNHSTNLAQNTARILDGDGNDTAGHTVDFYLVLLDPVEVCIGTQANFRIYKTS